MESHILMFPDMFVNSAENKVSFSGNIIDRRDLIIKSLYWDKIITTTNNFIFMPLALTPEVEVLKKEGLLVEENLVISGGSGEVGKLLYDTYMKFLLESLARKDINFIANEVDKVLVGNERVASPQQGELLTLLNAIPEPDSSVDIHDVLEFRLKRRDELKNLMMKINELNIRVMKAENRDLELKAAINEIDIACAEVIRLYGESRVKFNLSEVKFNFSISDILGKSGGAYVGATKFGLSQTTAMIAAVAAGISSVVNISDSISLRNIDKTNPFNYVGQMSVKLN